MGTAHVIGGSDRATSAGSRSSPDAQLVVTPDRTALVGADRTTIAF